MTALEDWTVISTYTRAQALDDGELVGVTETAKEAGFSIPVALTRNVWNRLVSLPEGYKGWQDEKGRLWDVVWMAAHGARTNPSESMFTFEVYVRDIRQDLRDSHRNPRAHTLWCTLDGGDDGEPVITVMFPEDY